MPASTAGPWAGSRRGGLCVIALLQVAAAASFAQATAEPAALERCASIRNDSARLTCYDAVAAAVADAARVAADPTSSGTSSARDGVESPADRARGIDAFGVEQLDDRSAEIPDEIESRLLGPFTGWRGDTIFRLDNGQVWRQSEQGRLVFEAAAPRVTIRRGAFGTYRLSVEGINSSVRVRRIE